jgi:solute carrier family 25 (mitochondrial thiamine pyrophosphate transporter), member 19
MTEDSPPAESDASRLRPIPMWKSTVAGCIAGAGARTIVAPLDLIRIRLQLKPHRTLLQHILDVAAESGLRGFFRGNVPATYLWMGYSAVQFSVYDYLSHIILGLSHPVTTFVAGALAGVAATLATYPLDLCRTNFAANSTKGSMTMLDFARITMRRRGFQGYFTGVVPGLYGIVPYMGFNFLIYESLVGSEKTAFRAGMAGAVSGAISKLLVYPLDTVKKRMQVQAIAIESIPYSGTLDCLTKIVRLEGFYCLYRGVIPSMMKNTIATSLSFSLYISADHFLSQNI